MGIIDGCTEDCRLHTGGLIYYGLMGVWVYSISGFTNLSKQLHKNDLQSNKLSCFTLNQ